jgi:hypothetical protein
MDPRDRADALLARARARGAFVVTPENATSPMDSSNTQQIPRAMVNELDLGDPDTTGRIPASVIEENDHPLAGHQPTKRLEFGGDRRRQPQTKALPQPTAPLSRRPQPAPVPSPLIGKPENAPPEPEPKPKPKPKEDQFSGLIPTTTQSTGRSNLSRRLDGI